jgi:hypothetical protein
MFGPMILVEFLIGMLLSTVGIYFGIGILNATNPTFNLLGFIFATQNIILGVIGLSRLAWFQNIGQKLCVNYATIKQRLQV